jgi:hypothetical protein
VRHRDPALKPGSSEVLYCRRLFSRVPTSFFMLEISDEIPFLWRLSPETPDGFSHVSMVIPFQNGSQNLEHTIPTSIMSFSGDHEKNAAEETLEWNEDDIQLFLKLLAARHPGQVQQSPQHVTQTFKVDLSDPTTLEIVNIVAAAGFGMTLQVDDLLVSDPGDLHSQEVEVEVGNYITLHTVDGYKRGIVVGAQEDEVVCVLLEGISLGQLPLLPSEDPEAGSDDIHPHDLVIVKPHQLLPEHYSSLVPTAKDIIH